MVAQDTKNECQASLSKISFKELKEAKPETIARLTKICEDIGFFIITDHPVPRSLMKRVISSSTNFFGLPEESKRPFHQNEQVVNPKTSRGYSELMGEKLSFRSDDPYDRKQLFDLGLERTLSDVPFTGPTIMPDDTVAPDFKRSLFEQQDIVMKEMLPVVTSALALALGKDAHFFDEVMLEPMLIQRVIYYPAKKGSAGKHTDNGLFTLLFQQEGEEGHRSLQVSDGKEWLGVEGHEDEVVVNLGDTLQSWTEGRFMSTPHMVEHCGKSTRISIPFFFYPNMESSFKTMISQTILRPCEIALSNFKSLWVTKTGGGRAQEVSAI